jgi:hypothetical protein
MRATEFVFESHKIIGKVKKRAGAVQQSVQKSRDKGGYDRTNHMNRLWMATAMADGKSRKPVDMDAYTWVEKYNTQHPYTEEEYNMFRQAEATVPTDSKDVIPWSKSEEPKDTHVTSPVSNWMTKK